MRLLLLSFCLFSILPYAFTQEIEDAKALPGPLGLNSDSGSDRAAPFWTEDFGGGYPAGWSNIDMSGICPWRHSFDGSWGFFSSTGITSGDPAINSTTGSNGFLICDADSANHFNFGQPSGANYIYLDTYVATSAINCSGHSSVILRFEHSYRYNNSVDMNVMVSNDNVSWTTFNVNGGLANNTASANPDIEVVNISAIAANQSNVYIRFGWNARVYFWMIDDISLSEADPNDVVMGNGYWGTGLNQSQYFKIPTTQTSPITFYGPLSNNTGGTLNNVYFDVDVNNGASVFSGTSNQLTLLAAQTDTATSTTNWTPAAQGTYTVDYDASLTSLTDGNLANNASTSQLRITPSVYGLDNLPADGTGFSSGISNFSGNTNQPFGIGNLYEIIQGGEIDSVEIGVTALAANEGNLIFGSIYYWDGAAWTYLDQTSDHSVLNSELGKVISLKLLSPVSVTAGDEILVVASHYGGTDVQFMMAQSVPNQMVYGYDGTGDWFYLNNPKAIVARASFIGNVSTPELSSAFKVNCFPNPATEILNVEINLTENSNVTVNLIDINGKLIQHNPIQEMTIGTNRAVLNTSGILSGVYTVEIIVNEEKTFKKISIR